MKEMSMALLAIITAFLVALPVASAGYTTPVRAEWDYTVWEGFRGSMKKIGDTPAWDRNGDKIDDSLEGGQSFIVVCREITPRLKAMLPEDSMVLDHIRMVVVGPMPYTYIQKLASLPEVESVHPRGVPVAMSDVANPAMKARQSDVYSPQTAWDLGYQGKGVSIAIMDTGVDNEHPSIKGKFLGGVDCSKPATPLTPRDGSFDPDDTNGHGTTCTGIAMGTGAPDGVYMGTAPEARLVDIRIGTIIGYAPGEVAQSFFDSSLQGIDWSIQHKDDKWPSGGEEYQGIDIVSLSWGVDVGYSSDGKDPYSVALDRAVDSGIHVVVAAGNDGPDNDGFTGMGAADKVITVGALDDLNTVPRDDDVIAEYSSRGPRADDGDDYPVDELKPDICAPGTNIIQAEFDRVGDGSGNGYGNRGSGTSYATPAVAGIVALMLEANPDLTPEITKEILRATAERRGDPSAPEIDPFWNKDYGWGMVDAYRAVKLASEVKNLEKIDVDLQCFVQNISETEDSIVVRGIAFSRTGEIEGVQLTVNGKVLKEPMKGRFVNWTVSVPKDGLNSREINISAVSYAAGFYSLPSNTNFTAESITVERGGTIIGGGTTAIILAVAVAVPAAWWYLRRRQN